MGKQINGFSIQTNQWLARWLSLQPLQYVLLGYHFGVAIQEH